MDDHSVDRDYETQTVIVHSSLPAWRIWTYTLMALVALACTSYCVIKIIYKYCKFSLGRHELRAVQDEKGNCGDCHD